MESGQTVGKYTVGDRVGQGGMSVVYRGLDNVLTRPVAIKVLHPHLAESREAKERFAREAKAVARLRHANILEIYDYSGSSDADHYIISEFIDGRTLKDWIEHSPLMLPEIGAAITWQLAKAVAHAHDMGVLHRDLKPENVMVRNDGVLKLTDFGIAHVLELGKLTVTGQLLGSPAYMAPEHVEGRALSAQTDIFSLGTILYQLCTGALPFVGSNAHEVLLKIADGRYADPGTQNPAIGNELAHVIRKALDVEPTRRFVGAADMAAALERYLAGVGLVNPQEMCAAYFAAPEAFTADLRARLIDALTARGREAVKHRNRAVCADIRARLGTVCPDHPALASLRQAGVRWRWQRRLGLALGAVAGLAACYLLVARFYHAPPEPTAHGARQVGPATGLLGAAMLAHAAMRPASVPPTLDERPPLSVATRAPAPAAPPHGRGPAIQRPHQAATEPGAVSQPYITLQLSPRSSSVQIDQGSWRQYDNGRVEVPWAGQPIRVIGRNESCCENAQRTLTAADVGQTVGLTLSFLPARVVPQCDRPGIVVQINGRPARLGAQNIIAFGDSTQTRQSVTVEFIGERVIARRIQVRANQTVTVPCDAPL